MCVDLSQDNCHFRIQDSGVIIAHGGETWLEQGGGTRGGCFNNETLEKGLNNVPVVVNGGEED